MSSVYDWASDDGQGFEAPGRTRAVPPRPAEAPRVPPPASGSPAPDEGRGGGGRVRGFAAGAGEAAGAFVGAAGGGWVPPVNVHLHGGGNGGNGGRGNGGGGRGGAPGRYEGDRHQGDRLIYAVERIELRSDKDILALGKAINYLGRELYLILGMRAEEVNGVLSTYRGKWYTFGAGARVKARLVSAHLKVSAEAAKALGVGALKMAAAFDRHFVQPEREARRKASGSKPQRPRFTIGDE
ncbi:hypothetical protein RM574_25600 [Streptomyces sp. DSM 41982]|uniref:Uncharacterized protein n=1 Tax=Streptomyces evansiae TaxID=3075535 RepID=A0ABD5EF70_9ACTN|nr:MULTISPECIES: hypothetical protein [unclassified Streptomyces]MDT0418860.1 hypothetical protein [Streptomyces sp. DSM 41982]SCD62353.1 hypothetical protein GA0115246_103898 [Streptomyces sp. SolWspMP-sol7th]